MVILIILLLIAVLVIMDLKIRRDSKENDIKSLPKELRDKVKEYDKM